MKTKQIDPWKPIRRGAIYCSPACGGGCTHAKFMEATRESARIAKSLGEGWTTKVHENLGWHYSVVSPCGRLWISGPYGMLRKSDGFTAFLGEKNTFAGNYAEHGSTPKKAIANVLRVAKAGLAKIGAVLHGF